MAIEIYCVKCKAKTDSSNVESVDDEEWPAGDQGRVHGVRRRQVPYRCDASGDELSQAHCLNKAGFPRYGFAPTE